MEQRPRNGQRGFSYVEVLVSTVLLGTLVVAVGSSLLTGQQMFSNSEAVLQVQQSNRAAIDAIKEDLTGAQIYGWLRVAGASGSGVGKVFVKFRRLKPSVTSDGTHLDWDDLKNMRMYVWCNINSLGNDPCDQIGPTPPQPNELLLVRADAVNNPTGAISGPWVRERVVTANLDATLDPSVALPFDLSVIRADNTTTVYMANKGGPCLGAGQECQYPFTKSPPAPPAPQVAGSITFSVKTRVQTLLCPPSTMTGQESLKLRNRQDSS